MATILAVTEPLGWPFDAAVFRGHVVLSVHGQPEIWFETLDQGRRIITSGVHHSAFLTREQPEIVRGSDYRAYYLDNLAARLAQAGDRTRAEAALHEAIRLAPQPARFRYNLGTLLLELGRYEEAQAQLRTAIRRGWDDADAWVNRGVAEWKLGRLRDARRSFQRAIAKDPGNQRANGNLRMVEAELKQP